MGCYEIIIIFQFYSILKDKYITFGSATLSLFSDKFATHAKDKEKAKIQLFPPFILLGSHQKTGHKRANNHRNSTFSRSV